MRNIKILSLITLFLIFVSTLVYAAPPLPVRVGGTLQVDGTLLTQTTDTGYTVTITKQDESAYDPAAEDTDGLNSYDYYIVDVPIYDSSEQPGGAQPGETAVVHVYLNGIEHAVTSPTYGEFTVGNSGSTQQINVEVTTLVSDISVTDSIGTPDDFAMVFPDLTSGLSINRIVRITNNGDADLIIGIIAQNNPLVAPFTIPANNCSGQTISPANDCTLTVRFSPTTTGSFNNSFDIPSNDPDASEGSITINVSGTGLSNANNNPPPMPILLYPTDGQLGIGPSLEFKWGKTIDPDLDSVTYYLYYCIDQDFINCTPVTVASIENDGMIYVWGSTGVLFFGIAFTSGIRSRKKITPLLLMIFTVMALLISCGGGGGGGGGGGSPPAPPNTDVTQAVSGLSSQTTYYWKVVADDGNGGLTETDPQSFTTQ